MLRSSSAIALAAAYVALCVIDVGCAKTNTTDVAMSRAANDLCVALQACSPIDFSLEYGSLDACASAQLNVAQAEAALPGLAASSADVSNCLEALVAAGCDAIEGTAPRPAACVFGTGTLSRGSACVADVQCNSGNCAGGSDVACGICNAPQTPVVDGVPCAKSSECASGLCVHNVCVSIAAIGSACGATKACGHGQHCDAASGTCRPLGVAGAACATSADCDAQAGFSCATSTGTCTAFTAVVSTVGGACGGPESASATFTECGPGAHCFANVCVADAASGAACDGLHGPACAGGDVCFRGTCVSSPTCN